MIAKRLRESLDSSICIRDIFEEGKKLAEVYGAENIYNFSIGNPSVEPPAIVNQAMKDTVLLVIFGLVPFNLIKYGATSVVTFIIYKRLRGVIRGIIAR